MQSWKEEMDNMLALVDRQVSYSLNNIQTALKQDGLSFNAEFKQFFLWALNNRVEETCNRFEVASMLENQVNISASESPSTSDIFPFHHVSNDTRSQVTSPVANTESSDEDDQPGYRMKFELLEELAAIQNDYHDLQSERNDHVEIADVAASCDVNTTNKRASITSRDKSKMSEETFESLPNKNSLRRKQLQVSSANVNTNRDMLENAPSQLKMAKRFKCQVCPHSCATKGTLGRHMRIHTGEKPYRCDICRKEFMRMDILIIHQMAHVNEIPLHCRICFRGFVEKFEKNAHEKVCKYRRYECHICKKSVTLSISDLKKHMRTHDGEKPFRCEICMKRFTQKNNLKRHMDTIHARINP